MSQAKEKLEKAMEDCSHKAEKSLYSQSRWLTAGIVCLFVWAIVLTWTIAGDSEFARILLPIPSISIWFCLVGYEKKRGDFKYQDGYLDGIGIALEATREIVKESIKPEKNDVKNKTKVS